MKIIGSSFMHFLLYRINTVSKVMHVGQILSQFSDEVQSWLHWGAITLRLCNLQDVTVVASVELRDRESEDTGFATVGFFQEIQLWIQEIHFFHTTIIKKYNGSFKKTHCSWGKINPEKTT